MTTIQTRYGAMNLYQSMDELDSFTYADCVNWLQFNDSNGCYSKEEQMEEFGTALELSEMKQIILDQSNNA
jgi:hypothetical protein